MSIPQAVRYPLAVVAGAVLGELLALPFALLLDSVFGAGATGGRWDITVPNCVLVCVRGIITGYCAGWISGKRGKLVGAFADWLPLVAFLAYFIAINQDPSQYIQENYDTKPVLWTWVGLIPAILGGHYGVKHGRRGISYLALGVAYLAMAGFYIGSTVLHVYTIVMAYSIYGIVSAVLTAGLPPLSEVYWLIDSWRASGLFLNGYSGYVFIVLFFLFFGGVMVLIGEKLTKAAA